MIHFQPAAKKIHSETTAKPTMPLQLYKLRSTQLWVLKMSPSIKRHGWSFRGFGYIERVVSFNTIISPAVGHLAQATRRQLKALQAPACLQVCETICWRRRLASSMPVWRPPRLSGSDLRLNQRLPVGVGRGEQLKRRSSVTAASWDPFPKCPPPSTKAILICPGWRRGHGPREF